MRRKKTQNLGDVGQKERAKTSSFYLYLGFGGLIAAVVIGKLASS